MVTVGSVTSRGHYEAVCVYSKLIIKDHLLNWALA